MVRMRRIVHREAKSTYANVAAFNGNVKTAGDALQNHAVFRRAWLLDELRSPSQWEGSPVLPRFAGFRFCGPDREGNFYYS